jgi:hypothetical protein
MGKMAVHISDEAESYLWLLANKLFPELGRGRIKNTLELIIKEYREKHPE